MSARSDSPEVAAGQVGAHAERPTTSHDDIAIVGMACRFPGGADYDQFWQSLCGGVNSVTQVPADRWSCEQYYSSRREDDNKTVSKWGGFIDGIDRFDAPLFQISPREAELMDPQQRIMLELAWNCMEDAGYAPSSFRGTNTGVYIGVCNFDYKGMVEHSPGSVEAHISTGVHTTLIPNRISYQFDLRGPSIPIDTACSSSLVALEQAVKVLRSGECSAALVGGVSVLLSPTHFISFSKAGMLSPHGLCRSFDERADGYVRGEGAGMILLKPLAQALRDGDLIYGLVKGAAVNHGGKVATITSPNPFAQSQVIERAFADAGISPTSVNYIEAHGTGTPKGDPIEVNALKRAYAALAKSEGAVLPERSCAIGTVKTNIGHLEAAAGIAGIIKVLLAMRHGSLPRMLHFDQPNPRIKTEGTPFHFVSTAQPWAAGTDGVRRAGVSSFGFGGVNAHVLLQDHAESEPAVGPDDGAPLLIVVSARTPESLGEYVQRLAEFTAAPCSLLSLAYSLQVREAMEERLAFEVCTREELSDKLRQFIAGEKPDGCWRGSVKSGREVADLINADPDMQALLHTWLSVRNNARLGDLWVKGVAIPSWHPYYAPTVPRKLRLPAYQFSRKRYWIDAAAPAVAATAAPRQLHPLVQENTSTLSEQRFSATFSGDEFFLVDHQVNGHKVLPGVAHLEMAQVALQRAWSGEQGRVVMNSVVWARPVTVGEGGAQLHVSLTPDGAAVDYEIYSGRRDIVHSHGTMRLAPPSDAPALDLPQLRHRLADGARVPSDYYALFARMGIVYGPAHRAIDQLWVGPREVLARVIVPSSIAYSAARFELHPSMLDAALQACLAIGIPAPGNQSGALGSFVPFAVDSVELWAVPSGACALWAWARPASENTPLQSFDACMASPFDLDLCDDAGRVCVAMRGLSFRATGGTDLLLFKPAWQAGAPFAETGPALRSHSVLFAGFGDDGALFRACAAAGAPLSFRDLDAAARGASSFAEQLRMRALGLLDAVRTLLREAAAAPGPRLLQLVVPRAGLGQLHAAFAGLLKTAHLEQSQLATQLIETDAATPVVDLLRRLRQTGAPSGVSRIGPEDCLEASLAEFDSPAGAMPWREGGVYLITGGVGGLGLIFAREICSRLQRVTVILAGRSAQGTEAIVALEQLRHDGVTAEYRSLDVSDAQAVTSLVADLVQRHGALHGVLHCAGINRDSYLATKDDAQFASVLAPKIDGTINLDEATRDLPLDLFVMFSSVAGALGNAGQADYATANAFLDQFAHYRKALPGRSGQTLSINWPLWREGGMQVDAATEQLLLNRMGMVPLRTQSGIDAFYGALASREAQVLVMEGQAATIRRKLQPAAALPAPAATSRQGATGQTIEAALLQMAAQLLKLAPEEVDARTALSEYGFDSIAYTGLASRIGETWDIDVSPAVFFDYPTIAAIGAYLWDRHRDRFAAAAPQDEIEASEVTPADLGTVLQHFAADLLKLAAEDIDAQTPLSEYGFDSIAYTGLASRIGERYGITLSPAVFFDYPTLDKVAGFLRQEHGASLAAPASTVTTPVRPLHRPRTLPTQQTAASAGAAGPIAIVGMSGQFPMAPDLETFWRNLEQGKDCIGQVPPERWDSTADARFGGFCDGIDEFDPLFFGILPREAVLMDPQQRLLMKHVWQTIEDAGYAPSSLSGTRTGIFVGTANTGYDALIARAGLPAEGFSARGVVPSVGPNRMSFMLNLTGPSEPVETACSSSLVAIHRAIAAIESGDCEQAIVGGVNTIVSPDLQISFHKAGLLAPDGRCKTFSSAADGYVRGEGVAMLFLKPLKAAHDAGDHIYGVIRGSAVNHGGRGVSLTSPNAKAQADVLTRAYAKAGIDARSVGCLEVHGTGTLLGDAVEINGIKAAFEALAEAEQGSGPQQQSCALACVKTSIGHLELAAGVAGVIKVLLQMRHQRIAPSLHCDEINPHFDLRGTPFHIARTSQAWTPLSDAAGNALPRRAGVSSFGFGGVNAHVVLEEFIAPPRLAPALAGPFLIPLSARNPAASRRQAENLLAFIDRTASLSLDDLAYTLQVGRDAMQTRLATLVSTTAQLQDTLRGFLDGRRDIGHLWSGQVDDDRDTPVVASGDHGQILAGWVQGAVFDWTSLYGTRAAAQRPRRIGLPTYPFARDRYWAGKPLPAAGSVAAPEPPVDDLVLGTLLALRREAVSVDEALAMLSAVEVECANV